MILKIVVSTMDLRNAIRDVNFGVNYSLIIDVVKFEIMKRRTRKT